MKKIIFALSIISSAALFSCSEKPEEPVPDPIILDKGQHITLTLSDNVDKIKIVSGSGGYSLVFPTIITLDNVSTVKDEANPIIVPYSEYNGQIFSLHIDGSDNIVIERKSLFDRHIGGVFMVKDSKGARRLFNVQCYPDDGGSGGGGDWSVDQILGYMVNEKHHWVNY